MLLLYSILLSPAKALHSNLIFHADRYLLKVKMKEGTEEKNGSGGEKGGKKGF